MGQNPARVHQVPQGDHEQQGRSEEPVRAQGGPHSAGEVDHAHPATRHAGGSQADGGCVSGGCY